MKSLFFFSLGLAVGVGMMLYRQNAGAAPQPQLPQQPQQPLDLGTAAGRRALAYLNCLRKGPGWEFSWSDGSCRNRNVISM
jgi:hypothetical protein